MGHAKTLQRVRVRARGWSLALGLSSFATGCLPYTMGSTAATVPSGTQRTTFSLAASFGDRSADGPVETPIGVVDAETRIGLSDRSDAGLRISGISGAVVSYKRRLSGSAQGAALSAQVEGGVVKGGALAMGGISVVASSADANRNALFGGVRYLPVARLARDVDRESATIGAFLGLQMRRASFVLLPELSVVRGYDDVIAHRATWFIIPSISLTRPSRAAIHAPMR
ncbi:MAG: hypothetical protein ABMA00_20090 [Gemmatimonas sp.]